MKAIILIMLFSPLLQSSNMDSITRAIGTGNVAALEQYMNSPVEIALLNQMGIYDKAGAAALLRSFFGENAPRSFSQVRQGASKGNDSVYATGNLDTSNGIFRVYLFIRQENGKQFIEELRISKE